MILLVAPQLSFHPQAPPLTMSQAERRLEIRQQVMSLHDLASRVVQECHSKCVPKPRDGDLSIAEMTCIDRCVPKYQETMRLVAKELSAARAAAAGTAAPPTAAK
jgi:hypothetical protein